MYIVPKRIKVLKINFGEGGEGKAGHKNILHFFISLSLARAILQFPAYSDFEYGPKDKLCRSVPTVTYLPLL